MSPGEWDGDRIVQYQIKATYLEEIEFVEEVAHSPIFDLLIRLLGREDLSCKESSASHGRNERRSHYELMVISNYDSE
jgi:hypothetical protein